jgi:hypothetical protein
MVATLGMSGHIPIGSSHRLGRILEWTEHEPTLPAARPRRQVHRPGAGNVRRVAAMPAAGIAAIEGGPAAPDEESTLAPPDGL